MLVLSRRSDESIVIPNLDIELHVLAISASKVRLGIDAPRDIRVLRSEIAQEEISDGRVAAQLRGAEPPVRSLSKSALLVDDNQNETRLLACYLRLKGFRVMTAANGAEAMQHLEGGDIPDVMVLDMNMPQFDGRWTVGQVRSHGRYDGMRIFAVSGIHPEEYGVTVGENGVDQWLAKPLNPEELLVEITKGAGNPGAVAAAR